MDTKEGNSQRPEPVNHFKLPSFKEATEHLRVFLAVKGFRTDIVWICREAVLEQWPKLYAKVPVQNELLLAERIFNEGVRRGLGAELNVFCFVGFRPCCYVWIPQDETDASYRMLHGLKLSICKPNQRRVVAVKSPLRWIWLNWFGRDALRRGSTDDIPRRNVVFDVPIS